MKSQHMIATNVKSAGIFGMEREILGRGNFHKKQQQTFADDIEL